jgi:polar amino acid transport system ATP-binding protein
VEIAVRGVSKQFGDRLVLDGVELIVRAGETVAIIGPSGGGKSTLLRCLNGLCSFDRGEIKVGDQVLSPGVHNNGSSAGVRRMLGMIFQDFQLFPHLTALQNIIEAPLRVLKLSKDEALERGRRLLGRVGLADREQAYPRQLSGGQKQRVAIARALAMAPRGLLCDEITSALDPELKNEVLAVIEDLKRDGLTLVMVTHEIGFARRAADRVVVLAGGKNVEEGPAKEVIDHPQTARTQEFLRCVLG